MKIKKRKNQGQSTKSLQTFDNPTKRRKPFNSGEQLRTKSGGSVRFSEEDDVDLDDDLDDDSSTTRIRVQPLTDRRFEIMNAASALRKESVQSYEDDDDNDDNYDDDDPAANAAAQAAYKKGEDPQKILDNWQESKIKKSQQQKKSFPASPDSPEQDSSAISSGGVKPLSSGLQARLPSQPRDLVAQIVKPRFVTLSWVEPLQNAGEVVYYTVFYKMNNSER